MDSTEDGFAVIITAVGWWRHTKDRRFIMVSEVPDAGGCDVYRAVIDDFGNLFRVSW